MPVVVFSDREKWNRNYILFHPGEYLKVLATLPLVHNTCADFFFLYFEFNKHKSFKKKTEATKIKKYWFKHVYSENIFKTHESFSTSK